MNKECLSITTRGIGLGTCNLCYIAATTGVDPEPPVYVMYRVFLGLAEAKLRSLLCTHEHIYKYEVNDSFLERPMAVVIVPTPIKRIIDAIDYIECGNTEYKPIVTKPLRDAEGRLVPLPENLLLSNLRETVVALSNPETPEEYRAAFKENCPIPGAVWDEDDLLLNADEIIPKDYRLDTSLWNEMWPVFMFANKLKEKYPLMVSGPLESGFGTDSSRAALVTSTMENLCAVPREVGESVHQYCKRCYPVGGLMVDYYSPHNMPRADFILGETALLGEFPNNEILCLPELYELAEPVRSVYSLRADTLGDRQSSLEGDYITALMQINEELMSQVVPPRSGQTNTSVVAPSGSAQKTKSQPVASAQSNDGSSKGSRKKQRN